LLYELAQLIFHLKIIKQLNKIKYKFVLNRKVVNYEKVIDFYFREYQSKTIKRFTSEKSEKYYFIKFWINLKNYFLDLILKGKNIFLLKNNTIEIKNFIKKGSCFHFPPRSIHQEEAITNCTIIEASTPHFNDRVRVEEKYGLKNTEGLKTTKIKEVKLL